MLIIDDVLDGGITLAEIIKHCNEQGAKATYSAVLANKQIERSQGGIACADFVGLNVDERYIFGAGMDYKGYLRNASGIFALDEQLLTDK